MREPRQVCKACNMPHDCHPDIEYYCAVSHELERKLDHALRERDKAIALLAQHMRHHNSLGGEFGYVRLFMADNGELKPMGLTCYESEVMIAFIEKGKP